MAGRLGEVLALMGALGLLIAAAMAIYCIVAGVLGAWGMAAIIMALGLLVFFAGRACRYVLSGY